MDLQDRLHLLNSLGKYIEKGDADFDEAKAQAERKNPWFIRDFTNLALIEIKKNFLNTDALKSFAAQYKNPEPMKPKLVGIIMAGNIPLVGFHDWLCCFVAGHYASIKCSERDDVLFPFLINKMIEFYPALEPYVKFAERLNGCDAYIATGSNNSSRYFEYYFSKYPNIIRKNRTSIAILSGKETAEELKALSRDIHQYFGLGCRNVTKIYVPEAYDFIPLLQSFEDYKFFADHHRYKNNYDYQLSIQLLNNKYYMTNEAILLFENASPFSAISVLHYEFYKGEGPVIPNEKEMDLQCIVSSKHTAFGKAQEPSLTDYADGVDTMEFLSSL